jgi:iron complex outermembrane receptor protein
LNAVFARLLGGLCCASLIVVSSSLSRAQFEATAEVEAEIPSTNSLDPTAAGTEIRVTDRMVSQSLDELLRQAAGTRVVLQGGQGSPFCLRLRGSPCDQSTVLLGEIPLSDPDTGAFDLSLIPIEALEETQVWRGGAPTWINQGSIGGVLRLMPRQYETNEVGARITGGSFESWRANAYGAYGGEKVSFFGTAGGAGSKNDYPYLDDGGTLFDPTDDVERRRQNADFTEGLGYANVRAKTSDKSALDMVFLGVGRDRGEPGPGSSPVLTARTKTTRMIGSASWLQQENGKYPYRLQVLASYNYWRNRFSDPFGRIGNNAPKNTDDRNHTVFGRAATSVDVQRWLELTTVATGRYYTRRPFDELAVRQDADSDRLTFSGTVETNFHGKAGPVLMELRPSVLLTWTRANVAEVNDFGEEDSRSSRELLPTYRVAGAIAPIDWLSFRGSVSSGFRLPTVLELFGNQGVVQGNVGLIPEKSTGYDAAVTARGSIGVLSGYASVGFFLNNIENQIRFARTSQFTIVFQNIESGRNLGVETEVRVNITQYFALFGELTWTQTRDNATGNALPGQPELVAFVRPEVHSGELSKQVSDLLAFVEVLHLGDSFANPGNLAVIPARTPVSVGIGALFFESHLGLGFRVDDVADVRGQDLLGFPVPGRRFSGRLSFRHAF